MNKYILKLKTKINNLFIAIIKWSWFKIFLSDYQWYRRAYGGHWELWYIDHPICSSMWLDVKQCSVGTSYREPGWRGSPRCENWETRI